jgi:hypothetical protein
MSAEFTTIESEEITSMKQEQEQLRIRLQELIDKTQQVDYTSAILTRSLFTTSVQRSSV